MASVEEGWHILPDGKKLYTRTWIPSSSPVALLIFLHGFSDHSNRYNVTFSRLASLGIRTLAFDQRGWGRSVTSLADRGDTGPTSRVLADITSVISSQLPSPAPLFLMGHSLGGAETLYYAAKGPAEIRQQIVGYLAESPWIALYHATQPSWLKVFAGRLAARVVPKWHLTERVNLPWVTRDKEVVKALAEDDLCHDTGTLEGFAGCFDRSGELDSGAIVLKDSEGAGGKARLWLGHGTEDRVTSFEASKRFVERQHVEDKEFKIYEGWFHQLHSEPGDDKITFANDVANWIIARSHRVSDKI